MDIENCISIGQDAYRAISFKEPIIALESTIISHGIQRRYTYLNESWIF